MLVPLYSVLYCTVLDLFCEDITVQAGTFTVSGYTFTTKNKSDGTTIIYSALSLKEVKNIRLCIADISL